MAVKVTINELIKAIEASRPMPPSQEDGWYTSAEIFQHLKTVSKRPITRGQLEERLRAQRKDGTIEVMRAPRRDVGGWTYYYRGKAGNGNGK